ncbi:hypothetical protein VPH35_100535 [Triticum aestivum]
MLRLRSSILAHLLSSSPAASPASPLHRLLSVAISPSTGSAVENYLFSTCGLTRAQAAKASPKLSRLKSPANPDAVLAFLSGADVAAVVARDPQLLRASVGQNPGAHRRRALWPRPIAFRNRTPRLARRPQIPQKRHRLQARVPPAPLPLLREPPPGHQVLRSHLAQPREGGQAQCRVAARVRVR